MAKKTWVNIDGYWREIKNVWINTSGTWKRNVIPKGKVNGVWKEFILYSILLYRSGVEYFSFSGAMLELAATFEKRATELYLATHGDANRYGINGTVATDTLIDLTAVSFIDVVWSNDGFSHSNNSSFLFATTNRTNLPEGSQSFLRKNGPFTETTDTIDVKSLIGTYYIGFGTRADSTRSTDISRLHVKKIELR